NIGHALARGSAAPSASSRSVLAPSSLAASSRAPPSHGKPHRRPVRRPPAHASILSRHDRLAHAKGTKSHWKPLAKRDGSSRNTSSGGRITMNLKTKLLGAAVAALVAGLLAGAALAAGSPAGAVVKVGPSSLGRVLVDAHGKTLYLWAHDKGTRS